ncbi:ADP-ribosylation factor-like protein 1 [Nephila pilipes]|uniref:ADP-ribosylation factor-like protein 1 n=1 Tax=Nephila pilipes TaxID=299642 RepID=A0A8X6NC50_NEPPI|nr:ADP-ribosylation factor-like protein 1 [Nephila pilipes]
MLISVGEVVSNSRNLRRIEMRILFLGLDGVGKTTLVNRLKLGEFVSTRPTLVLNLEEVTYKNLNFQAVDLGGKTLIRRYWRNYFEKIDAVIFVVDSTDEFRMELTKHELYSVLENEELKEAIFVVLANKQDLYGALTAADVCKVLGLEALKQKNINIFPTAVNAGEGLEEVMEWLSVKLSPHDGNSTE